MIISNTHNDIYLKKSPFVFLKAIVVIQFIFGLFPILLSILLNFSEQYNATTFAQTISYNILVVAILGSPVRLSHTEYMAQIKPEVQSVPYMGVRINAILRLKTLNVAYYCAN